MRSRPAIRFSSFINEYGGKAAGALEVVSTPLPVAYAYADKVMHEYQHESIDQALPMFKTHYMMAQHAAAHGWTHRHEMPVLSSKDVPLLTKRLEDGALDIQAGKWQENLSGDAAKRFLVAGGLQPVNKVKVSPMTIAAKDLKPIQKQIYFDKCMESIAKEGIDAAERYVTSMQMVASSDHHIIDGHHRWLSALIINPDLAMTGIQIDLPIAHLLPLLVAYGDSIGNRRNL
jgi:hypothetical protein